MLVAALPSLTVTVIVVLPVCPVAGMIVRVRLAPELKSPACCRTCGPMCKSLSSGSCGDSSFLGTLNRLQRALNECAAIQQRLAAMFVFGEQTMLEQQPCRTIKPREFHTRSL